MLACRPIAAGEEVTYDYATSETPATSHLPFPCSCSTARCRGMITGWDCAAFPHLLAELQRQGALASVMKQFLQRLAEKGSPGSLSVAADAPGAPIAGASADAGAEAGAAAAQASVETEETHDQAVIVLPPSIVAAAVAARQAVLEKAGTWWVLPREEQLALLLECMEEGQKAVP